MKSFIQNLSKLPEKPIEKKLDVTINRDDLNFISSWSLLGIQTYAVGDTKDIMIGRYKRIMKVVLIDKK